MFHLSVTNAERRLLEKSSCSPEKHLGSPGLRKKKMIERGSPEKQSQFQPLTPDKHNQFHCEIGQSPANAAGGVRQRARTVSTAGGETMKRELARKKLARLREQESKAAIKEEAEETPLARTTIFEKLGARSPTHRPPGRQRTSSQRQHIFQVKVKSVIERCVIRQIMSCLQRLQLRSLLARTTTVVVQWEQLPAAAAAKRDNKIMDGQSVRKHGNHHHQKSELCDPFQSQ